MVEKVGFTNCVFEKLCFAENTICIVFSAKHSFSKTKTVCWQKTENLWKIVGCFWTWQNGVFWFFSGFNITRFVFGVSGIVSKVLKMLVFFFPVFWAFLGWLFVVHLGLEGLGVFVFLVFVFVFLCRFCFCFICFVLGFVVGCCCFVFLCFFVFFCVFFCFVCFFVLCFFRFVFLEGLRVRWGALGPKPSLLFLFFAFSFFGFLFFVFFVFVFL